MAASTTSRVREWLRAGANGDAAFPTGSCVVSPAHAVAHEAGAARYLEPARCPAGQTEARVAAALVRPEHPARAAVAARRGVKTDVLVFLRERAFAPGIGSPSPRRPRLPAGRRSACKTHTPRATPVGLACPPPARMDHADVAPMIVSCT